LNQQMHQGQHPGPSHNATGILELTRDGHGYLRSAANDFMPGPDDVFLPVQMVRGIGLLEGSEIVGVVGPPKKKGGNPTLVQVISVDGLDTEKHRRLTPFKDLVSIDPSPKFDLEGDGADLNLRVLDMMVPVGKGQRGLIVAPPRSGKTIILQKIAQALNRNHPEVHLMVLLVDERPEEVTDMRRSVKGEVISSTLDQPAERHVRVAEMVLERLRRMVESGRDVVILLDSLTRLARSYNLEMGQSGRTLSGGLDARTMEKPREFFGSARKVEKGGSLTIIATCLVDTGSRMDQVIFEEFKGTGNMETVLSRELANKRVFPAIDINGSGTRKEEKLHPPETLKRIWMIRRVLAKMKPEQAMEALLAKMQGTKNNTEFLEKISLALSSSRD
jgi:transcription termination factor Rho